jgi:hypothetical protein
MSSGGGAAAAGGGGTGSGRVSIPNNVRTTIQNIKEITGNHSEEDIYAMLKECSMDPNETTNKLLLQGYTHSLFLVVYVISISLAIYCGFFFFSFCLITWFYCFCYYYRENFCHVDNHRESFVSIFVVDYWVTHGWRGRISVGVGRGYFFLTGLYLDCTL